jgi:hypothetical protein
MPVRRNTASGSMPNDVPTSRFETTCSGRYEPVPIILVRIISLNTISGYYYGSLEDSGIIGLDATGVN